MFATNACRLALFSLLSLSANAETVRGAQRELDTPATVQLGAAGSYAILAKSGISTVPDSSVISGGHIGVSPIAATAITGFGLILNNEDITNKFSTSTQVGGGNGKVLAADYGQGTAVALTSAVSAMEVAYTDAAGRASSAADRLNFKTGLLSSETLKQTLGNGGSTATPGVYTFSTDVSNIDGPITIHGSSDDIFIIQIAGDLLVHDDVILTGDANAITPENIFWQVAGKVVVEAGVAMKGILLVKTDVTFKTDSTLNGRVLTQTRCDLDHTTITAVAV
jgi:hypothetical protein